MRISMNVAFIPVRGGSKSIPLKNIRPLCGKPLVYWTVKAACGCKAIDKVYVATDSEEIRKTVETFKTGPEKELFAKAEVIGRSAESASDTASTESAMLEFAEKTDFNNIALVQATSPLLTAEDLDKGFEAFQTEGTDAVLSVVRQKRFNWKTDEKGFATPANYRPEARPRRQDFEGYLVENGAFYITSKERLQKTKVRISGRIKAVEMPEETFFEIDEPSDWIIIEELLKKREEKERSHLPGSQSGETRIQAEANQNGEVRIPEKANQNEEAAGRSETSFNSEARECQTCEAAYRPEANQTCEAPKIPEIKMFLTDCDGCLTDGGMYYTENGDELKKFNTRDGVAVKRLREHGILTGILTGESVELNTRRAEKLKIDILEPGCTDKLGTAKRLCEKHGIPLENVCYIGDDLADIELIKAAGFGAAPANAVQPAKEAADYVTRTPGGQGAIRELADLIIGSRG